HAVLVRATRFGLLCNRVRLPCDAAGVGVERRDTAPERTARIPGCSALSFLAHTRSRHVELSLVKGWRARRFCVRMVVDLAGPDFLPGGCVDRVGSGAA